MMLMTPLTALAPHSVPPAPRITSMRSMSARTRSTASQKTPENSGLYTLRPSTSTTILLVADAWKPRALTAQVCPSRPTDMPLARRRASAIVVAPARRIASPVMTTTAAAASVTTSP